MKRKIYVIMFLILISISMPIVSFARTYINEEGVIDSTEVEEDDDEEEDDSEDGETEPTEPTTEVIGPGEGIEPGEGGSTGEGVSYTNPFETINGRKYWVGWRKYHYNFTATPTARKGDSVEYTYRIINTTTGTEETKTGSAIAKGYGLYSLDYNKHILGLLYYMSRKIAGNNYLSSYVPDDVLEFNADGTPIEQEYRLMDVACKEIADRIIETFYSSDYEQGKFKEFWEGSFTNDKANILGKLQSEFYCNAYAVNAISKLNSMGFPFNEVNSKEKAAIYGMIFSIMESRYRDKNLNGKTNLQLKVSEGDLWPFLVYCENITAKKQGSNWVYTYEWPDIDTIVDGAYQWMYYYDSKFETSTSASTITSLMVQNEVDDEADEADWEAEYLELTNEDSFPYLNQYKLQEFYSRVAKVRSTFKKLKENTQGIFGAEEIYDITSEVSYTTAMEDMKKAMVDMCKGTELSTIWKGLTAENIARTYMMAKNIVENERVQEEYAYYNIGTNVINATPGLQGNEYMLVDFERIRLEQPLRVKDKNGNATIKTYADTDKDGLYDRDELGKDGETFDYYDITKFIEKMVLSELYGSHYKIVNELPSERKESVTYLTKSQVNDIMTNFKKNLIRRRKDDSESDGSKDSILSSGNTVDPKDQAEYYLNCFKKEDTDGSRYASIEDAETAKIKVELYAFDSNPIFKDTDFDGVPDGKGYAELQRLGNEYGRDTHTGRVIYNNLNEYMKVDLEPQNNKVSGLMKTTNYEIKKGFFSGEDANTHMDYRYFFMNNKNYYDELSTMSLMLCNTLEHNENSGSGDLVDLTTLFRRIGLKKWNDESVVEIKTAKYGSNGEVKYVVGENEIEYTHNYTEKTISKKVKLIVVKSIDAGKDNIEKIGNNKNNINNHELFEGLAKAIYDKEFKGKEFCYWVTGYNTGGAVANVLAAKMIDNGLYYVPKGNDIATGSNAYVTFENGQKSTQAQHTQVITNVYAYTFGAPYTIYNGKEVEQEVNTIADKYCSIFNVVSNADISAYMMPHLYKWGRYGVTCYKVIEEYKNFTPEKTVRMNLEDMFRDVYLSADERSKDINWVFDNSVEFKNNYYKTDYGKTQEENLKLILDNFMLGIKIPQKIANDIKNNQKLKSRYTVLIDYLNTKRDAVIKNRDEKVYYELSKKILPEDISFIVNTEVNGGKPKLGLYDKYPNFQAKKKIDINNPVPSIFQDAEVWSQFRYGRKRSKETKKYVDGSETVDHSKDANKEEKRQISKFNDSEYSYGTFWESSCGVTAPAIVLSYIFEKEITPIDVRDKIEEYQDSNGYNFDYRTGNSGTNRDTEKKIAELYGLSCEHINYNNSATDRKDGHIKVVKELLKGNPVICHTNKGPFGGGHYIVIAGIDSKQVDDLKKKKGVATLSEAVRETRWNEEIDKLTKDDLKDLDIYVLDPRSKHEYSPSKKSDGKYKKKTMTTAWKMETFKSGGDGKADEFWIYTKSSSDTDVKQEELFNYNIDKYSVDYEEYFDPQYPDDSDKYCNPAPRKNLELDYYGKKPQSWFVEFDTLFK